MNVAINYINTGKWKSYRKVKNIAVSEKFIILTYINDEVKVINRDDVRYMRETKLYER